MAPLQPDSDSVATHRGLWQSAPMQVQRSAALRVLLLAAGTRLLVAVPQLREEEGISPLSWDVIGPFPHSQREQGIWYYIELYK